jgi:hypothetical protein
MPDINLAHHRIGLCHYPEHTDNENPDECAENRGVNGQDDEDQNDCRQSRYEYQLSVGTNEKAWPGQCAMDPAPLQPG